MKYFVQTWMIVAVLAAPAFGALPKEQVAADAKWLLHFDVAQFRSSRVGGYIVREILQKKLSRPLTDLKGQFKFDVDPDKILDKVSSITIYGTDYQSPEDNSVLLIRVDPDIERAFVGVLAGMSLAGSNAPVRVDQTQMGDITFSVVQDKVFIAVLPGKVVAVGKSRAMTEQAAKVLQGKAANLKSSKAFSDFPEIRKAFFFLGVAEGFSADTELPPQARLLQLADGGRVVLGEDADQVFVSMGLRAKSSEVVTQMQQVIQGVIAMGSLGQPDDKDLAQLVQSVKVTADKNVVNVSVEYPVEKVIQRLGEQKANADSKKHAREAEAGKD